MSSSTAPVPAHRPPARVKRRLTAALLAGAVLIWPAVSATARSEAKIAPQAVGQAPRSPAGSLALGSLASDTVLQVDVVLRPRDPGGLTRYATSVSTPGSANYRRYLPQGQFAAAFGPETGAVANVESTLRGMGLHPGPVNADGFSIPVSATATELTHAFGTGFTRYRLAGGRTAYANTSAPYLPASAAAAVQGILGLDNLQLAQSLRTGHGSLGSANAAKPQVATAGARPCPDAQSASSYYGSFTADELAAMYGLSGLYSAGDLGAGQTVAVYELEPYEASDIATFQRCYGTNAPVGNVSVDGGAGVGYGEGEAALDIEDVIGLAPKARIAVYEGPNSYAGVYDTYAAIMAQDTARVISVSWGLCEAYSGSTLMNAENVLFEQAAIQGQTVLVASGDAGSEGCSQADGSDDSLSVDDPASQPFVTSVGGTKIVNATTPPAEVVWNEPSHGASGGGISEMWAAPAYQQTYLGATGGRLVPDVAADADASTGYTVFYGDSWTAFGGTSAGAPLWAAIMALTNASCSTPIGFANPAIYHAFSPQDPATVGYDVVADPNSSTPNDNDYTQTRGGQYPVTAGYDLATGLGSPQASALAPELCAYPIPQGTDVPGDFTGTGQSSPAVFRPANGTWYVHGGPTIRWGVKGDVPVAADYDDDGRTDVAVYRPTNSTWWIPGQPVVQYGLRGDIPVVGRYDGRTDIAVYRPSTRVWYLRGIGAVQWGLPGDLPVAGDFNGDGRTDIAVYRPSTGVWYLRGIGAVRWGLRGDVPVVGDFNGDGRSDITVYRPFGGGWYLRGVGAIQWGLAGDTPVVGDFDGTGKTSIAVYRPVGETWLLRGISTVQWGQRGDVPVEGRR
jgi:subtilase family serine protease